MFLTRRAVLRAVLAPLVAVAMSAVLGAGHSGSSGLAAAAEDAPPITARRKPVLRDDAGRRFKDSNANGVLDGTRTGDFPPRNALKTS